MECEFNEYETLYLIHGQDEQAYEKMSRYALHLVNSLIRTTMTSLNLYFRTADERADLISQCMMVFDHALYRYQENGEFRFTSFLKQCIYRQIMTYFRSYRTISGQLNRRMLSLDGFIMEEADLTYLETIESKKLDYDPVKNLEMNLLVEEIHTMMKKLKPLEVKILKLRMEHYSFDEIAEKLLLSPSNVRYIVRKIKKILKGRID